MTASIFVHIVTFNHQSCITPCLAAVVGQHRASAISSLQILVTDNASTDETVARIEPFISQGVNVHRNNANLGFAAAHNAGIARFLESGADLLVILNPDVALEPAALAEIAQGMERWPAFGAATGLLVRSDENLRPLSPEVVDSAGMVFTTAFRHFDRFADRATSNLALREEEIDGATGAYLVLRRGFVQQVALDVPENESLYRLYPALREGASERCPLFDEAFFAYREDAELAIRAKLLGARYILLPRSRGAHLRRVTPERRDALPPIINRLGVRNRFLLQASLFSFRHHWRWIVGGLLWRNAVVLAGVVLAERSSLPALREFWLLLPRALARRREVLRRSRKAFVKSPN